MSVFYASFFLFIQFKEGLGDANSTQGSFVNSIS